LPQTRGYYASRTAGIAWQLNRWDDGRKALDRIEAEHLSIDPDAMSHAQVIPLRTVSGTYALTGPFAKELKEAERKAATTGNYSEAADAYSAVLCKLQGDDKATVFVRGRAAEHRWRAALQKGDAIDVTPGADLAGWYPIDSKWESDGKGTLTATAAENGASMIVCGIQPGEQFEFAVTIDASQTKSSQDQSDSLVAGPLFSVLGPHDYFWLRENLASGGTEMFLVQNNGSFKLGRWKTDNPLKPEVNELVIHEVGQRAAVTVNGESVVKLERGPLTGFAGRADNRLGLLVTGVQPGSTVRFSKIRVQRGEAK